MTDRDHRLLARLEELDDPDSLERPRGFDDEAARKRFDEVVRALEAQLGTALAVETGASVQDASFHSEVRIPRAGREDTLLRFSSFGDLVALWRDDEWPEAELAPIVRVIEEHGYTFVPLRLLTRPYPRRELASRGVPDWWTRYFDWL